MSYVVSYLRNAGDCDQIDLGAGDFRALGTFTLNRQWNAVAAEIEKQLTGTLDPVTRTTLSALPSIVGLHYRCGGDLFIIDYRIAYLPKHNTPRYAEISREAGLAYLEAAGETIPTDFGFGTTTTPEA
jgi:hypothetical protein